MWNPRQYERFRAERKQPFLDLLALVERRPRMRVVDLGCGTGELTRELHEHLGADETVGIDRSETMLLESAAFGSQVLRFERGEIEGFVASRPFDLVFSNAALHWVAGHEALLARLTSFLSPHGQIAIQMPANDDHPSHAIAAAVAMEMGAAPRPVRVLPVEAYARALDRLGYVRQHVRLQVYGHLLDSTGDVIEWARGALLTEYEAKLGPHYEEFLHRYRTRLLDAIGVAGPYFYTYKRILMWGTF
ncbi:MAG TPA: methyltransferase domain-containing protein [Thermoanaerobaculia bacterium]|nr:methyltransferase domain-containing protein [Thermoanaerobaculia bacterium]